MPKWKLPGKSRDVILALNLVFVILVLANNLRLARVHDTVVLAERRGNNDVLMKSSFLVANEKQSKFPSYYYRPAPTLQNLWQDREEFPLLPPWLRDYFAWHQKERQRLTNNNWTNWQATARFLIPVAPRKLKSGGMTDRIRPIAAYLRLAAETNRLLLIYWERPCALEEFLLPPEGGLDWRVPPQLLSAVQRMGPPYGRHSSNWTEVEEWGHQNHLLGSPTEIVGSATTTNTTTIITFQYQSWHYGELWYTEHASKEEATVAQVFRDIWHIVFTPSPPVAERIHTAFQQMLLIPGEYTTVHIRALYGLKGPRPDIQQIAENAMNCGSHLRPGGPFFLASDSSDALRAALDYGKANHVSVVTANHSSKQPFHLDLYTRMNATTPADFYDGFVDLYLMASTRCVAVGPGGFARWGHLLGYNRTCAIHHSGRKSQTCDWKDATTLGEAMPGYSSEQERLRLQMESKKGKDNLLRFHAPMSDTTAL